MTWCDLTSKQAEPTRVKKQIQSHHMRGSYVARIMRKRWEAAAAHRLPARAPLPSPAQCTSARTAVVSSVSLCRYVVMSSGVARCRQVSLCVVMSSCGHAPLCRHVVMCRYVVMCRHVTMPLCRYVVMSSGVVMCRYVASVVSVVMSLCRHRRPVRYSSQCRHPILSTTTFVFGRLCFWDCRLAVTPPPRAAL